MVHIWLWEDEMNTRERHRERSGGKVREKSKKRHETKRGWRLVNGEGKETDDGGKEGVEYNE